MAPFQLHSMIFMLISQWVLMGASKRGVFLLILFLVYEMMEGWKPHAITMHCKKLVSQLVSPSTEMGLWL